MLTIKIETASNRVMVFEYQMPMKHTLDWLIQTTKENVPDWTKITIELTPTTIEHAAR